MRASPAAVGGRSVGAVPRSPLSRQAFSNIGRTPSNEGVARTPSDEGTGSVRVKVLASAKVSPVA
jgi:hypothetical protein